jgi:HAD superfamily hydrolase (TIGR01509 family)
MKYKCIIFDNDGVLIDSEIISNKVMVEMAKSVGVTIDMDYAMKHFSGVSLQNTMDYIERKAGKKLPDDFEQEFRKRTFERFKTDLKPVKGVAELLGKISVPCCVASSGPREKLELSLKVTNLIHKFEHRVFSCYDIGAWKPNPDIFLYAAKEMGFKPGECAVVEDSLAGVKAAKAGGFDVYGFANERNKREFEELGATVFFSMEELAGLLGVEENF